VTLTVPDARLLALAAQEGQADEQGHDQPAVGMLPAGVSSAGWVCSIPSRIADDS
jgi:hypothetical protein